MSPNDTQRSQPGLIKLLAAPWAGIFRPRQAVEPFLAGSTLSCAASFAAGAIVLVGVFISLAVWNETVFTKRPARPPFATTMPINLPPTVQTRSVAEIWQDGSGDLIHPMALLGLSTLLILLGVMVLAAWLFLPFVHGGGSVRHSYARSLRTVAAGIGALVVASTVFGGLFVAVENHRDLLRAQGTSSGPIQMLWAAGLFLGVWLIILWLERSVRATAAATSDADNDTESAIPPLCEGCGYDLTHAPDNGLCPECALPIELSLLPNLRRPGCDWEHGGRNAWAWWRTSSQILFRPAGFYAQLKLRTPAESWRGFATRHYATIGVGAAIWIFVMILSEGPSGSMEFFIPLLFAGLISLASWGVHRFVAAA
ncbi:MAG: hypothetical protein V3T70_08840, partial [Phycisphaerae bacterium]